MFVLIWRIPMSVLAAGALGPSVAAAAAARQQRTRAPPRIVHVLRSREAHGRQRHRAMSASSKLLRSSLSRKLMSVSIEGMRDAEEMKQVDAFRQTLVLDTDGRPVYIEKLGQIDAPPPGALATSTAGPPSPVSASCILDGLCRWRSRRRRRPI
ncbi:hypothetical protein PAHAL_5G412900 [Panicum hallii]|uniref:Uncharacterized protein n=1 Tax=Panicum hallii TaxID=206008 RepID=A0A2T8IMT5_9POAL|nr:hypothetical protein PAHAL_5G412900 [Panicum hallii]